ncbi:diguanylate cyclase [Sphingomonas sp. MA1305]|nr:diguanylate cyclase [Sphingomonas sp. MA1305]
MPNGGLRRTWAMAIALLFAVLATPATAAIGTALDTCIARVQPHDTPATMFGVRDRFDCRRRQSSYGSGDFWIRSRPFVAPGTMTAVRFASTWQDRVTLYVLHADGHITRHGFDSGHAGNNLMLGATFQFMLPPRAAPPVQILWRVERSLNLRGVISGARIADHHQAAGSELGMAALYAAFAGMCLALLIYNLALWAALRQAFQPAYCLMVLCLLGYAFSSSGLLGQITDIDNNDRMRINYLLLAASAVAALTFARAFFERRVFDGWLRPASSAVAGAVIVTTIGFALFAPHFARPIDAAVNLSYLLLLGLVPAILWRAWRLRSNHLWIFALAWGGPVFLAGVRILAAMNVIAWHWWIDQSTLLAMAMEAALSSLGVAYRIRLLSVERDEAREQEIAARLLAATDPLTGLLNRRAFLEQAIGREGEQRLILADIDHFKTVNETIGHDGGDEVLRVVARALQAAVPAEGLVARVGGEEFALIVPAGVPFDAEGVLDRLRAERMPFDMTVTASVGTCVGPLLREIDWKALYRCADRALFEAKAAGRDRVRDAAPLFRAA